MSNVAQTSNAVSSLAVFDEQNIADNTNNSWTRNESETSFTVVLATANVRIQIADYISSPIRALLDTGAQLCVITKDCVKRLRLKTMSCHQQVSGIGGSASPACRKVSVHLKPWFDAPYAIAVELFVMDDLAGNHPSTQLHIEVPKIAEMTLADETFDTPAPIDMLLGAEVWAKIVRAVMFSNTSGLLLQQTMFGYVLLGRTQTFTAMRVNFAVYSARKAEQENMILADLLKLFWETQEIDFGYSKRTPDQELAEKIFAERHFRSQRGRYIVQIPIKSGELPLGDSREIALKRYFQLERRLSHNEELRIKYVEFMREYEQLGHMKIAEKPAGKIHYYIPHHCVNIKFRVVFDASCKTTDGRSLNDIQPVGQKLQHDLADQIMRFRRHLIAVIADIEKMFRQISIDESQWDLQRIFWRESPNEPLKEYQLTVVTYGMAASVFNSVRALQQCGIDNSINYPYAARAIANDFYVDDLLSGASSVIEASLLCAELDKVLKSGGFNLRHWVSNSREIQLQTNGHLTEVVDLDELNETKVLGLRWLVKTDEFTINAKPNELNKLTKRTVLSEIARMYDPNGFLAPFVVVAKILMQDLWREENLGWDGSLPQNIAEKWSKFHAEMKHLNKFRIPRWLNMTRTSITQIHGFCDASSKAYGAVIYVRTIEYTGKINCLLLTAKSRVAPLQTLSIPRLELQSAELLSRLMKKTLEVCELSNIRTFLHTDSTIVLQWLRKQPCDLKTFVANRVAAIQSNTRSMDWVHVASEQNPADLISRGMNVNDFLQSKLWLNGPIWLQQKETEWPTPRMQPTEQMIAEIKNECKIVKNAFVYKALSTTNTDLLTKFSDFMRIKRITAYMLRFVDIILKKKQYAGRFDNDELLRAEKYWIRIIQLRMYKAEIIAIQAKDDMLPPKSKLSGLRPYLDADGILRVGGRIDKAEGAYDEKHPIILPPKTRLTWFILYEAHYGNMTHSNIQNMMRFIRNRYWIPKLRLECKTFISRCVRCVRYSKKIAEQIMADLPAARLRPARPFAKTGVDLAGPYHIKLHDKINMNTRSRANEIDLKGYIIVFVCLVTRAVHLEAVTDMTTEAFLRAFVRFTTHHSTPEDMYSDNGTNFVGADNELSRIYEIWQSEEVEAHLRQTKWHFITPAAPHEGGLWEAAVKQMKYHLMRVMGPQKYTFECLQTLLAGVEACMNSRPICAMSDDPNDLQALTPAHFWNAEPLVMPLAERTEHPPRSKLKLFQDINYRIQQFWSRWQKDYIPTLLKRPKWKEEQENLKAGQLVLIMNENYPPTYWMMGRILRIIAGTDSCVRQAEIKVDGGILMRSIRKLCVLPVDDQIDTFECLQPMEI